MTAEKTAILPVTTDEAFALLTDPDRLRRWKTVSARVDLRVGGEPLAVCQNVMPGISEEDLTTKTPCSEFTVAQLAEHLIGTLVGLGRMAASILSLELLIHAWDFAVATRRQVTVSDEVTSYVLELAKQVISPQQRAGGSFAAEVAVGPDAHILERLIAFSGRVAA